VYFDITQLSEMIAVD